MLFIVLMHSQKSSPWAFSSPAFTFEFMVHGVSKSRPTCKVTEGVKHLLLGCLNTEAFSVDRVFASKTERKKWKEIRT